jgi:hypothetical protein
MRASTMKKASKKKPAAKKKVVKPAKKEAAKAAKPVKKKVAKAVQPTPPASAATAGNVVTKQPQVKQQAADANGMFLYTDDAWSLRYFDQNDLHFKEREVFG